MSVPSGSASLTLCKECLRQAFQQAVFANDIFWFLVPFQQLVNEFGLDVFHAFSLSVSRRTFTKTFVHTLGTGLQPWSILPHLGMCLRNRTGSDRRPVL